MWAKTQTGSLINLAHFGHITFSTAPHYTGNESSAALVAITLAPGGDVAQWLPLYAGSEENCRRMLNRLATGLDNGEGVVELR